MSEMSNFAFLFFFQTRQDAIQSISNVMTVVMASDGVARTPKFRITYTS